MSEYIKYFDNGGKNMSYVIEDDNVLIKYNEIQNRIKGTLGMELHSKTTYDDKYMTWFILSFGATKFQKKATLHQLSSSKYLQVYLKDCRYGIKNKKGDQLYRR